MSGKIKKLLLVFVLLILSVLLYRYSLGRPVLEEPKKKIPVDSQLTTYFKKEPEIKDAVELVQKFYWNAWMSDAALKNGGWKNILSLCTDDFADRIKKDQAAQDAISIGSIHDKVLRVYLDTSRSKIVAFLKSKKNKNIGMVLVDLWLGIDQKRLGDYFLHQQTQVELVKKNGKWLIQNIVVITAEEKPATVIPE